MTVKATRISLIISLPVEFPAGTSNLKKNKIIANPINKRNFKLCVRFAVIIFNKVIYWLYISALIGLLKYASQLNNYGQIN